jgi:uncharacterized iron-regulated membrane protein
MVMYVPWGVNTAYRGDSQRYYAESGQITAPRPPIGSAGTLGPVGPMVLRAIEATGGSLERIAVANPRDARSTVVAVFEEPHGLSHEHPQVAFDGTTGEVLEVRAGGLRPAAKTFATMVGLHEAHFASPSLRILFFLSGLAGSSMVATGLLLWAVARLPKAGAAGGFGLRLVQSLNVATIAGLPTAIAGYFLANRLLPVALAGRADWEVRAFLAVWLLVAAAAWLRPPERVWPGALAAAAGLFAAVAVADLGRAAAFPASAGGALPAGCLAFDAAMLALAALFAFATRKTARLERGPRRVPAAAA